MAVKGNMRARIARVRISLEYGGQSFELVPDDFDISDNIDEVLEAAMRIAREGSRIDVQNQIDDIAATGMDFTTNYTVNTEPVKPQLKQIAPY